MRVRSTKRLAYCHSDEQPYIQALSCLTFYSVFHFNLLNYLSIFIAEVEHVMKHSTALHDIMLYDIVSYDVILYRIISFCVMLYYVILLCKMSHHIMQYMNMT